MFLSRAFCPSFSAWYISRSESISIKIQKMLTTGFLSVAVLQKRLLDLKVLKVMNDYNRIFSNTNKKRTKIGCKSAMSLENQIIYSGPPSQF